MLRKALVLRLALSASVAAGPLVAVAAGPFFAEEPPQVAGAPFSAVTTTESVTVFADGNRITRTNTVYYYRDGQGRTRTERGDGPTKMISIDDPVSEERYFVRPESKMVFAIKQPAGGHVVSEPTPPADDMGMVPFGLLGIGMGVGARPTTEASSETTDLGQKSVNGVMATGVPAWSGLFRAVRSAMTNRLRARSRNGSARIWGLLCRSPRRARLAVICR